MGVFAAGVLGTLFLLYYATRQIDYIWRWYKIPRYFFSSELVEIKSEVKGVVKAVSANAGAIDIRIVGADGQTRYPAPEDARVRIAENDNVFPGDVLATFERWQAGILLEGLWVTLKVSVYSIFFRHHHRTFRGARPALLKPGLEMVRHHVRGAHSRLAASRADLHLVFRSGHRDQRTPKALRHE